LKNRVKEAVKEFIYKDEDSNFGHRDSLLNPCHNKIDVGIYYDSFKQKYYIVANVLSEYINYTIEPKYENNTFEFAGFINKKFEIDPYFSIFIYYLNFSEIKRMKRNYDFGKIVAGVSLTNVKFLDFETIYPTYFLR